MSRRSLGIGARCLALALGGCAAPDAGGPATRAHTTAPLDSGTATSGEQPWASLAGVVTGPDGALADAEVMVIGASAEARADADDAGAYELGDLPPGDYALYAWTDTPAGLATLIAAIALEPGAARVADLHLPALDPATDLGDPTEHELGEGLLVTVGAADLEPPLFAEPATGVAGARVGAASWPPLDGAGDVVEVWYLDPVDHRATNAGLPVRVRDLWGLDVGDVYEVRVVDPAARAWVPCGALTVGTDGFLAGDAALPLLGTVALVAP